MNLKFTGKAYEVSGSQVTSNARFVILNVMNAPLSQHGASSGIKDSKYFISTVATFSKQDTV